MKKYPILKPYKHLKIKISLPNKFWNNRLTLVKHKANLFHKTCQES